MVDGACYELTLWECILTEHSIYWIEGETCTPDPCGGSNAACCLPDGTCILVIPAACRDMQGEFFGDWVDCDPNPCEYPPGACCFETGQCVVLAEEDCLVGPGAYAWFQGLPCDPDPCPTSSVPEAPLTRQKTWGKIKAYR
jgi:hypothetical protein